MCIFIAHVLNVGLNLNVRSFPEYWESPVDDHGWWKKAGLMIQIRNRLKSTLQGDEPIEKNSKNLDILKEDHCREKCSHFIWTGKYLMCNRVIKKEGEGIENKSTDGVMPNCMLMRHKETTEKYREEQQNHQLTWLWVWKAGGIWAKGVALPLQIMLNVIGTR